MSLRATAMSATCLGLPAASSLCRNAAMCGSQRTAARAAMYNAFRTRPRPPAMARRPRYLPLSRATGASPVIAPTSFPVSCPSSGSSATKAHAVLALTLAGQLAQGLFDLLFKPADLLTE